MYLDFSQMYGLGDRAMLLSLKDCLDYDNTSLMYLIIEIVSLLLGKYSFYWECIVV